MSTARETIFLIGLLSLGGCVVQATAPGRQDKFGWATRETAGSKGCRNVEHYAIPQHQGAICKVDVLITSECDVTAETKSTFIAFPTRSASSAKNCVGLRAGRDFFAKSAYAGDARFLPLLEIVSDQLHRDILSPSESFKELGAQVMTEFGDVQMSAITGVHLAATNEANEDRYRISFFLPKARAVVSLEVNADGANPEWALVVR